MGGWVRASGLGMVNTDSTGPQWPVPVQHTIGLPALLTPELAHPALLPLLTRLTPDLLCLACLPARLLAPPGAQP